MHSHIFPRNYLDYLETAYADVNSPAGVLARRVATNCRRLVEKDSGVVDVDVRLRAMDQIGLDVEVLSLGNLDVYGASEDSPQLARVINDTLARICRDHPGRFRAFASVPLNKPANSCEELERAVEELDMTGVIIISNVNGMPLDGPEFREFFATVERLGVPLVLHPTVPIATEGLLEYGLSPMVGFVYDTGLSVLRLIFSGLFDEHPSLRLVVPHLGGMLHYLFVRIDGSYAANPQPVHTLERRPSDYMRDFYYDTVNFFTPAFRCAIEAVGTERLVLGTDYPFFHGRDNLGHVLEVMDEAGLSAEEREDICSRNALALLTRADSRSVGE
jgi:aminocarboxymuconate-semialdehyde decarboxylase